jgi:hypothetical protein
MPKVCADFALGSGFVSFVERASTRRGSRVACGLN